MSSSQNQKQTNQVPQKQKFDLGVFPYGEEFADRACDLFISTYQITNPMYKSVNLTDKEAREIIGATFYDKSLFDNSVVIIDKNTGRLLGGFFQSDAANIEKASERVFHPDPRIALKQKVEFDIIDKFFENLKNYEGIERIDESEPSLLGNIKPGQVIYHDRFCIDPKVQKLGIAKIIGREGLDTIIRRGYKCSFTVLHNENMGKVCLFFGGKITHKINLEDLSINGEYIFKGNSHGVSLSEIPILSKVTLEKVYGKQQVPQINKTIKPAL